MSGTLDCDLREFFGKVIKTASHLIPPNTDLQNILDDAEKITQWLEIIKDLPEEYEAPTITRDTAIKAATVTAISRHFGNLGESFEETIRNPVTTAWLCSFVNENVSSENEEAILKALDFISNYYVDSE